MQPENDAALPWDPQQHEPHMQQATPQSRLCVPWGKKHQTGCVCVVDERPQQAAPATRGLPQETKVRPIRGWRSQSHQTQRRTTWPRRGCRAQPTTRPAREDPRWPRRGWPVQLPWPLGQRLLGHLPLGNARATPATWRASQVSRATRRASLAAARARRRAAVKVLASSAVMEAPEELATRKLYVGNIPRTVTNDELSAMFAAHGTVVRAEVTH